jgi:hypothetical protein
MKLKLFASINLLALFHSSHSIALPPPTDTPEEILRTEIILDGRSPVTGEPLTASEYAELQTDLAQRKFAPELNSEIQHLIFLLRIRKLFKTFIPLL